MKRWIVDTVTLLSYAFVCAVLTPGVLPSHEELCAPALISPSAEERSELYAEVWVPLEEESAAPTPSAQAPEEPPEREESPKTPLRDAERSFWVQGEDGAYETTMAEFLPGVLAGEMPASFEEEALRAQAVAARTYILRRAATNTPAHPDCAVCTSAACCEAWLGEEARRLRWGERFDEYNEKLTAAVRDTDGAVLLYEDEPILACFHACSPGATESAEAVWVEGAPYLVSVRSPETAADVPNYISSATYTPEDFAALLKRERETVALTGEPGTWLGETALDASGRVESMMLGTERFSGTELRRIFALRSAAFQLWWTGEDFLFTVTGSGHGVGMSQYGANVMARAGSSWREILAHYYPGAELTEG